MCGRSNAALRTKKPWHGHRITCQCRTLERSPGMKTFSVLSRSAVVLVALAAAWLTPANAEWRSDAWITTKTKMALLTTEGVSSTAVNVDTVDGRVTLHGKVETAAEKEKAEAEAKKIEGVTEVRNLLQVVPAA